MFESIDFRSKGLNNVKFKDMDFNLPFFLNTQNLFKKYALWLQGLYFEVPVYAFIRKVIHPSLFLAVLI